MKSLRRLAVPATGVAAASGVADGAIRLTWRCAERKFLQIAMLRCNV